MATINIFRNTAFGTMSLTAALERNPYVPTGLGELNLFKPNPIRGSEIFVEDRAGSLVIIPTSPLGAPPKEQVKDPRKARSFRTTRLAYGDTLYASEIAGIRQFGEETELMQTQVEVARRAERLQASMEATWERHRLGAIQGKLLDADGSTIYNFFTEFGITEPTTVFFNLAAKTEGTLRPLCNQVVRGIARAAQGAFPSTAGIYAACGDTFWDLLTSHPDVTKTYLNWNAATDLREGNAFEAMRFGGIDWFNYRGTDDGSTIAIPADKCRFFPNAPGMFEAVYSPAEGFEWVNTPGKPLYVIPVFDKDRGWWWRQEMFSYPLFMCMRPEVLWSGDSDAS